MKTLILVLAILTLSTAWPLGKKFSFRNLFEPVDDQVKPNKPQPRIIGGHEAVPHSIPYQAFIESFGFSGGQRCGGSLISTKYVLTTAACVEDSLIAQVTLGAHRVFEQEPTQVSIYAKKITIHEDYDRNTSSNMIAVIELAQPVEFNDYIKPVSLPSKEDANKNIAGDWGTVSGWGLPDGDAENPTQFLKAVNISIITNDECSQKSINIQPQHLCTSGAQNTGPCVGDNGGPLTVAGEQVGIYLFGTIMCMPDYPSVFTRVTSFLDWIDNNTDVNIH